ncbi:MAG TPA: glucan 1,4-alpha-glucosidase [Pirellulales bacterium]|nr:glucan 1,4-alpha-glucosidase [Pirellulales bacterium]
MEHVQTDAPGPPGVPARWTSSAKEGVGTSLNPSSRVWFTHSHGIVDEIYYPRLDSACTRDLGLLVTDGRDFFSDEKRHTSHQVEYLADGVPAYRITNTCVAGRYVIEKELLTDPVRDVLLQRIRFTAAQGSLADFQLFALLAPHLGNHGAGNTAWVGEYKGVQMLFAERNGFALALASSAPWLARSAGYVGTSDGWQDLSRHRRMNWHYERAEKGNVALTGQIDLSAAGPSFVLALGFGRNIQEAAHRAAASMLDGFDSARDEYLRAWQDWQRTLLMLDDRHCGEHDRAAGRCPVCGRQNIYRVGAAVIHAHEAKNFPGGLVASLSIPWGFSKGDDDLGGYHLVWPRDLVETTGGLMAAGARDAARRVLRYLQVTQEADGHWAQNQWIDGTPYWDGVQMDESALPILLLDMAYREGMLDENELAGFWPMVEHAAGYIVANGPVTQQDRWEEDSGYSPFTLAAEVAALLAAADIAERLGEGVSSNYLRETADHWYASIDGWIYARGTELARRVGVDGYYVRIAPPESSDDDVTLSRFVAIKNRAPGQSQARADEVVSPDALALVRFGLRRADDPRMVNTVKVLDALLRVELPAGPCWYRYNEDGYGEHDDGRPFDGTGVGRPWPMLVGERAHYELASGNYDEARRLLHVFEGFANGGGLFPEQVWDRPDLPERELFLGKPAGSAMPLVWAHAEHIKLVRSLRDERVFDMPPQTVERYLVEGRTSPHAAWRFNHKIRRMAAGKTLRVETLAPALVHWSADGWQTIHDSPAGDTGLGIWYVDLPSATLPHGAVIDFTFFWPQAKRWEETDFRVTVEADTP